MSYLYDKPFFVLFHNPKCKKCGIRFNLARFPFEVTPETPELKKMTQLPRHKTGVFYAFYYRCSRCGSIASILDCYYATHPKQLAKEQKKGRNYRVYDLFYAGLHGRLRQKEKGVVVPEPTVEDTEKNWLPQSRLILSIGLGLYSILCAVLPFALYGMYHAFGF